MAQLESLSKATAISVAGFAVMDNHLHLLVSANPRQAQEWSSLEVAKRWSLLHPPRNAKYRPLPVDDSYLRKLAHDTEWIEATRAKLVSLSQYMKELKQRVAELANRQDKTVGPFWAGRFTVKAVTDRAQALTVMTYIDLNPFAAGMCSSPEQGQYTSLQVHLSGVAAESLNNSARSKRRRCRKNTLPTSVLRARWWLMPLTKSSQSRRSPLLPGLSLKNYLLLLDSTARMLREGKRVLKKEANSILSRLGVAGLHDGVNEMQRYWDRRLLDPVPLLAPTQRPPGTGRIAC